MGKLLHDRERSLFDRINSEFVGLVGNGQTNYYHRLSAEEERDPISDEPTKEVFQKYTLPVFITWPENMIETAEATGPDEVFHAEATVSRKRLDVLGASYPEEGDIIEAWRTSSLDARAGGGMVFNVVKVAVDGVLDDSSYYTQFILSLERKTSDPPERRLKSPSEVRT